MQHISFFILLFFTANIFAKLAVPEIIIGRAEILQSKGLSTITTKDNRTVIHWNDFSIGIDEMANFIQPSDCSAVLNRITSQNPSEILGTLKSNGHIFLINPNGIFIGKEGMIDVGGLIASTLDVSNKDFVQGQDMLFSGTSEASIDNLGKILVDKGNVYLFGKYIINEGDISALSSKICIASTGSVLLKTEQNKIFIGPDLEKSKDSKPIELQENQDFYQLAIKNTGTINALGSKEIDGEIYLIAEKGEMQSSHQSSLVAKNENGEGGLIQILGDKISLTDEAKIDVSNDHGDGKIFIGGGFQGNDPSIKNASKTIVTEGVQICSDALISGNGGDVVVWADNATDFQGSISAKGGPYSGNGATVEVSGKKNLSFTGQVNTTAENGIWGLLILDPTDVTISNAVTSGGTIDTAPPGMVFSNSFTAASANLRISDLNDALQTSNVLVTTTSLEGGTGDITIADNTALNCAGSQSSNLTLAAFNDIIVSSTFSFSDSTGGNTSVLTFNAGNEILLSSSLSGANLESVNLNTTTGDILLDNAITFPGATVTLNSARDIITQGTGTITTTSRNLNFNAVRDIVISNDLNSRGEGPTSNVSLTAGGLFNNIAGLQFFDWNTATISTLTGNILIDSFTQTTNVNALTFNSAADIINQGGTNRFSDISRNTTELSLNAGVDFIIDSQIDINHFKNCAITAGNDFIYNDDFEPDNTPIVTVSAGNDIVSTVSTANIITVEIETLTFSAGNDIKLEGGTSTLRGTDDANFRAENDISITTNVFNNTAGNIHLTSGRDINIGPSSVPSQVGTREGTISVNTGRDLNLTGGITTGDRARIGFSSSIVDSDIELTIGRDLNLTAGDHSNAVALIGHGFATQGIYSGDIIIHSVGGDVILSGGPAGSGGTKYAQIGHARISGGISTFSGNIRGSTQGSPANIEGSLILNAGSDSTSYALFGHGGRNSSANEKYSGEILVKANEIILNGGSAADSNASIGFYFVSQGSGANTSFVMPPSKVQVISDTTITMTGSTNGVTSIGARALVNSNDTAVLDLDLVDVQTGGDLIMISSTGTETEAMIGAYTDIGTASTALNMNIGGDLLMTTGSGSPVRIVNGSGTVSDLKNTSIRVAGDITPTITTTEEVFIQNVTGDMNVTAGGTIFLPEFSRIENLGGSSGELAVRGGELLLESGGFINNSGTGFTYFASTASDVNITDGSFITASGGIRGFAKNNLSIEAGAGSDSFITSALQGSYFIEGNLSLTGVSALEEAYIENLSGDLTSIANNNITIDPFSRITTLGSGDLTLVVDNQEPNPRGIGSGSFSLSSLGSLEAAEGRVRIFTAIREQNSIEGTNNLNGSTFVATTLFENSSTEIWSTYFPSDLGGDPFTVFYKNGPIPTVLDILALNPSAFMPFAELFYILDFQYFDYFQAWQHEICVPFSPRKKLPPYLRKGQIRFFYN